MKRLFFYLIYYGFAKHLPESTAPAGFLFKWFRFHVCRHMFAYCGQGVNIESGVEFHSGRNLRIGDGSGIGKNAVISGMVTIGDNVMMGPHVTIWTKNHNFSRTDIPMNRQGFKPEQPVVIEDDVWIGSHVIILPGVRIGSGSILGAGAVITKDVPPMSVAAGNPAKVIKVRSHITEDSFEKTSH